MKSWNLFGRGCRMRGALAVAVLFFGATASRQGPAPETAPPLFPGGGLVSYNSVFTTRGPVPALSGNIPATARPTFEHEGDFNFTWGFYRNFDLTILVPIVTNQFEATALTRTGLGDAMALVKYRFYRRDSQRGTTQASVSFGPKVPTGRTDSADSNGNPLPTSLQPGSGSTDFFLAANWTYTGLFKVWRLVADEDIHSLLRSQGTHGSGGDLLLAGATTYVGLRPGMHVWLGTDWDVVHRSGAQFMPIRRHISFGIAQQFRIHL